MDDLPLRDIHLPGPVSWWPPAPGWWLLMGLVLGLVVFGLLYRKRLRVRRAALRTLRSIEKDFSEHGDGRLLVSEVSMLLRRVCLTYRPREAVASVTGDAWRAQLSALSRSRDAFSADVTEQILTGPYNPAQNIEPVSLIAQTRGWLRALPPLGKAA